MSILKRLEEKSIRTQFFFRAYRFLRKKVFHKKMSKKELENDRQQYIAQNTDARFAISKKFDYICRDDKYANNGGDVEMLQDYFIQDIWGARKVSKNKPSHHYDVGSSVAGFIAHLLGSNQRVTLIDIRPLQSLNTNFLNSGGGHNILTSRCD